MIANRLIRFLADHGEYAHLCARSRRGRRPADAGAARRCGTPSDGTRGRGIATPGLEPVEPLRGGVVCDVAAAARLIAELLRPARRLGLISRGRSCARRIVTTRTTRHLRSALQALVQQRRNLFLRRREAERLVNPASSAYVILVDRCRRWHLTPTAWA